VIVDVLLPLRGPTVEPSSDDVTLKRPSKVELAFGVKRRPAWPWATVK